MEYDFTCKYENGIEMRVANSSRSPFGMGTTWYGDLGWVHVDRGGVLTASDPKILDEVIGENEIHLYKSTNHYQNFICFKGYFSRIAGRNSHDNRPENKVGSGERGDN